VARRKHEGLRGEAFPQAGQMTDVDAFPTAELIACAEHALRSMQRRYPGLVLTGRLKQARADRRMAAMAAIVERLRTAEEKERLV